MNINKKTPNNTEPNELPTTNINQQIANYEPTTNETITNGITTNNTEPNELQTTNINRQITNYEPTTNNTEPNELQTTNINQQITNYEPPTNETITNKITTNKTITTNETTIHHKNSHHKNSSHRPHPPHHHQLLICRCRSDATTTNNDFQHDIPYFQHDIPNEATNTTNINHITITNPGACQPTANPQLNQPPEHLQNNCKSYILPSRQNNFKSYLDRQGPT
jgi:hypothetical protein